MTPHPWQCHGENRLRVRVGGVAQWFHTWAITTIYQSFLEPMPRSNCFNHNVY